MDKTYIYLIHIFIVAPLFIYTGYLGDKLSTEKNEGYKKYFWFIILTGILVILYHSFLLIKFKNIF
jgi:hypothetical protein